MSPNRLRVLTTHANNAFEITPLLQSCGMAWSPKGRLSTVESSSIRTFVDGDNLGEDQDISIKMLSRAKAGYLMEVRVNSPLYSFHFLPPPSFLHFLSPSHPFSISHLYLELNAFYLSQAGKNLQVIKGDQSILDLWAWIASKWHSFTLPTFFLNSNLT